MKPHGPKRKTLFTTETQLLRFPPHATSGISGHDSYCPCAQGLFPLVSASFILSDVYFRM